MTSNKKSQLESASTAVRNIVDEPPSYEQLRAERDLKETFAKLVQDQEEIQRLFTSVSAKLEITPNIGAGHSLYTEWDGLRKKHARVYRDSQLNASQCVSFINNYTTVLVPLSKSHMTIQEKTFMINKFIEVIPVHEDAAKKVAMKFRELAKLVEVFPVKVSACLRAQADAQGFWTSLWSGIEDLCMSLWNALHSLFTAIMNTFRTMLSRIENIRVCAPYVGVHIQLSSMSGESRCNDLPSRSATQQAGADYKAIRNHLTGFEDAWHLVRLACNNLLESTTMASSLSTIPEAFSANLRNAENVHNPLVQCLSAYAHGKAPL